MTTRQVISFIFLVLFPLFEAACYTHLHWKRNDILIRKRQKSAIYVASLAGWLAYFNLVISIIGGVVPCGVFYVASLLVAPISVGPQIVRALTLRGTIKYSQLVIEDEISSRVSRKTGVQLPTIPSELSDAGEGGQSLPALVAASEKKIEAELIMEKTNKIVKVTKCALLVIPTLLIVLAFALTATSADASQLSATDFSQCQPEPTFFFYLSPAFGAMTALLAIVVAVLVKQIDDELHIAEEIRRNSIILGCTYIVLIVMRFLGHYELQPLLQTIQQMTLSFSMAIIPFLPSSPLNNMATWAKHRINPATKSAVPGYGRPLPKGRTTARASIQNVVGRRRLSTAMQQSDQRNREMTVSWDAGLCILLSTENGINLFSQHCAREFSAENVRFWCAVNDYRAKFDEEKCLPTSTEVSDDKSAPTDNETNHEHLNIEITSVAKEIYGMFIDSHSNTQVNLSSKQRTEIKSAVDSGQFERETFDAAQREIFSVMSRDSYPRFLASKKNRLQVM